MELFVSFVWLGCLFLLVVRIRGDAREQIHERCRIVSPDGSYRLNIQWVLGQPGLKHTETYALGQA